MLKALHIRDFAVIEALDLELNSGMTVFTGETGAGKSIIVDAMGLVLGDRADSSIIRAGQDKTEIIAQFQSNNNRAVQAWLAEQEIEAEDELMIRRVVTREGRSRAFINGIPASIQQLRTLGEHLVDIHGQHAHQSLLQRTVQRELLDGYGQYDELLERVAQQFKDWHETKQQLDSLTGTGDDRDARLTLLQYQVDELATLELSEGEVSELEEQFKRLNNANRLLEAAQSALHALSEREDSILGQVHHHINELTELSSHDDRLQTMSNLLNDAAIQLQEASDELRHYSDHLEMDPEQLDRIERRLSTLHDTARKHKVRPEELAEHLQKLTQELELLNSSEQRYQELNQHLQESLAAYQASATELFNQRQQAAKRVAKQITAKMKALGMPGGKFEISIEHQGDSEPQATGLDRVEFRVSANPGQPVKPLNKVASGGELSRISLAIQVISNQQAIPCLVFDEVDSGIGGGTAEIVGQLLHSLTQDHQVFCVTHLAQVASFGDHHLFVAKSTDGKTTTTTVQELDQEQRVDEIARMLGGLKITDQSRAHAEEMLKAKDKAA